MQKWWIKKRSNKWFVYVPKGAVASIPFLAPFSTYEQALNYVRYWLKQGRQF